jgi:hypothetical protein
VRFFLEGDEHVGNVQLSFELGVALQELHVESLRLGELRLSTRLLRVETSCAMCAELRTPGRHQRAVDAFPAQHGSQCTALAAGKATVCLLHDAELVSWAEHPAAAFGHRLQGALSLAERTPLALALHCAFRIRDTDWLGHDLSSILRPLLLRFPGGAVSNDVGTLGSVEACTTAIFPSLLTAKDISVRRVAFLLGGPISAELPRAHAPITKIRQQLWAVPVRRRSIAEPHTWRTANTGGIAKAVARDAAFVLAGHVGIDVSRDATGTCLRCRRAEAFGLGDALCTVLERGRSRPTLADTLQVFSAIGGEGAPIAAKKAFRVTGLGYGRLGQWTDRARLLRNSVSKDFTVF